MIELLNEESLKKTSPESFFFWFELLNWGSNCKFFENTMKNSSLCSLAILGHWMIQFAKSSLSQNNVSSFGMF
jgi:hypothetical protein